MAKAKRFHQQLREAREKARQSTDVMGILLNMGVDDYVAIERGLAYPDNETLKRLCVMLDWNFYDTQRSIINEMSARPGTHVAATARGEAALNALQHAPAPADSPASATVDTLGARLCQVRESTGQSAEIIAMLLGLDVSQYQRLEAGEAPGDELLRRISMVYNWNYYDLQSLLRSQQARSLQPRRLGSPYPGSSAAGTRLKSLLHEMEGLFATLPSSEQQFVLTQLEVVRETLRKLRPAS